MLKPYDSDLEYQSNGDIYYRPSEVTFSLLEDSAKDSYVGYLQTLTLDSAVKEDVAIDHVNLYSYSGPTQKWTFYLNDSDDNWVFLKTDNATKSVVSTQVLHASTISANINRNLSNKRLVQLFGYRADSTDDLEYRYFDSNLSEFGDYTVFEKADKKFILFGIGEKSGRYPEQLIGTNYYSILSLDSSLRDRDSNGQLIDIVTDSYQYTPNVDSAYCARLIRLRPVESGIVGDSNQYYRFGFEVPIHKSASEVDSLGAWFNSLHLGLRDYVNDEFSLDHFNFTGFSEAQDSEFSSQLVTIMDSALDSADIPTGQQLGQIASAIFDGITGDSVPRSLMKASSVLPVDLWKKFYSYTDKFITTDPVNRNRTIYDQDSSIAASVDSFRGDSGYNAHVNIHKDYLIRIDSV